MILLSTIIDEFESKLIAKFKTSILPGHQKALAAMKMCRSDFSPKMLAQCSNQDCQMLLISRIPVDTAIAPTVNTMNLNSGLKTNLTGWFRLNITC